MKNPQWPDTLIQLAMMYLRNGTSFKRGGDRDIFLLQRQAYWIYTLQIENPKSLNEEMLLGCFL